MPIVVNISCKYLQHCCLDYNSNINDVNNDINVVCTCGLMRLIGIVLLQCLFLPCPSSVCISESNFREHLLPLSLTFNTFTHISQANSKRASGLFLTCLTDVKPLHLLSSKFSVLSRDYSVVLHTAFALMLNLYTYYALASLYVFNFDM